MATAKSDHLRDRWPSFPDEPLGPLEVSAAYGREYFPRLAKIAASAEVGPDAVYGALKGMEERMGDPKAVAEAVESTSVVRTCADGLRRRWGAGTPPRVPAVAAALLGRCAVTREGRDALRRFNVVGALASALAHQDAGVRAAAAAALARVAESAEGRDLCLGGGSRCVEAIVAALRLRGQSSVVAAHTLSACASLAADSACRREMLRCGAVPPIVAALAPRAAALTPVAAGSRWADARDAGRIDPRAVTEALRALALLATDEGGRRACAEAGAVPAVVAAARDPAAPDAPLPSEGAAGPGSVSEAALVRRRRRAATAALLSLAVGEGVKRALGEADAAGALAALAADADATVAANASQAIRAAAEHPDSFRALVAALLPSPRLLVAVLGVACAQAVNGCLTSGALSTRRAAAETIADIAQTEEGRRVLGQCLHCVPRLARVLAEEDARASEAARHALARVLRHDKSGLAELRAMLDADGADGLRRAVAAYPELGGLVLK